MPNDADKQDDGTREIAIEAWNIFFGRAMFNYIRVPESWVTGYQLNEPLVTNRFLYKNRMWVGIGETECLISSQRNGANRPNLDFTLKVVVDLQKQGPVAPTPDDLLTRHMKKDREVVEHGELRAGNHAGSYALWIGYRRRFGIIGRPILIANLEGYIPCEETARLLTFTWKSQSSEMILENASKLVASLNSVLCHGHES